MKIAITELKNKIMSVLVNMPEADREITADYLIWSEMTGIKTQGIIKLAGKKPLQNIIPDSDIKIQRETKVSALMDAGKNLAIVASKKAADIAIKKAKETGMSIVGVRNIFSSNGAQAYYVEQIAKHYLVGIMFSRCPSTVAPFNSIDYLFGTNPVGFAFPTNDDPITFDAATSAMTFYGVIMANSRGEQLPKDVAIDGMGNPTTDAAVVIDDGALLPFGNSHKAAGIGMLVELMTGPLIGGAFLDTESAKEWGTTIIAIDPNIFTDINEFKKNCSEFASQIRNSRGRGNEQVRLPGDRAQQAYKQAAVSGMVEIDDATYNQIFK